MPSGCAPSRRHAAVQASATVGAQRHDRRRHQRWHRRADACSTARPMRSTSNSARRLPRASTTLRSADAKAVVLTGQGRMFSAGVDLMRAERGGADYVRKFLPALHRLYDAVFFCPKPVVAAINGHAIAGGCGAGMLRRPAHHGARRAAASASPNCWSACRFRRSPSRSCGSPRRRAICRNSRWAPRPMRPTRA